MHARVGVYVLIASRVRTGRVGAVADNEEEEEEGRRYQAEIPSGLVHACTRTYTCRNERGTGGGRETERERPKEESARDV